MASKEELASAARLLTSSMSPREASALMSQQYNASLKAQEDGKVHPMSEFSLIAEEWKDMKGHLMDGGGVVEDEILAVELMTAMMADDQKTFWPDLIHLMKAWLKIRGYMVGQPGGGTFLRGVAAP